MKKGVSGRRIPRRIAQEDDETAAGNAEPEDVNESILVRPSAKPRKGSSLRTSFTPGPSEDEETESSGLVNPKRSKISRIAIQRNAAQRSFIPEVTASDRQISEQVDRPSYNAAYLQELKDSTPSTPRDFNTDTNSSEVEDVANDTQALDISSKFGSALSRYQQTSAIPSAAEIAEKKARRARLAKEQAAEEFISLDPSDPELDEDEDDNITRDERGRLILKPKDKYGEAESRLVRDDEDIMENFDEFTEADGKILFNRKAETEAMEKRRAEMSAQIAEAEGASDVDSDESERGRNEAFEVAQTQHGTYGSHQTPQDPYAAVRPKTPPLITPLPTLEGVIERLRKQVSDLQTSRMQKLQEMEALQKEKIRLGEEEIRIQKALRETAEKFQQLRAEKGLTNPTELDRTADTLDTAGLAARLGAGLATQAGTSVEADSHGLESLGSSATAATPMDIDPAID